MNAAVEEARRIGALSESFTEKEGDPFIEEIDCSSADEIREILQRVEELAWHGIVLDDLLDPRHKELRHAFPGARRPASELSRILYEATGFDRSIQREIDAVMLEVRSGVGLYIPLIDFLTKRAGLSTGEACNRLAPLFSIQHESVRRNYRREIKRRREAASQNQGTDFQNLSLD